MFSSFINTEMIFDDFVYARRYSRCEQALYVTDKKSALKELRV